MTDEAIVDATFVSTEVAKLATSLTESEIASSSIAQLTARHALAGAIHQTLQHVINTDLAIKLGMVLESDDRQWWNITKKDLVGDTSDYAVGWKSCRKQFTDQRKADGSTNTTVDWTRLQLKGQNMAEQAAIDERIAAGETLEDTGAEVVESNGAGNKERAFDVRFLDDLTKLVAAYDRAIEKESEDDLFEHVSLGDRDLVAQYIKPCLAVLTG